VRVVKRSGRLTILSEPSLFVFFALYVHLLLLLLLLLLLHLLHLLLLLAGGAALYFCQ
jgi:hypothetical protein